MEISNDLLNKILNNGPSQATLFLILSRMRDEGHLEEVIRECEKALDLYPDAIRIRQLLAEVCIEAGQISKAESELESITSDIDKLAPSYRMLSNLYNRQKKQEESARAQRLYIAHRPDDQEAINLLETLQPQEPSLELDEEPETETEIAEAADLPEIATSTLAEIFVLRAIVLESTLPIWNPPVWNPVPTSSLWKYAESGDHVSELAGTDRISLCISLTLANASAAG